METKQAITREQAKAAGLKRYFTGEPCGKGHVAERSVSGNHCLECSREAARRRRAENPEKQRKKDRDRYEKNRDKINSSQKSRRAENPERFRERDRAHYAKNADLIRQQKQKNREDRRDELRARSRERRKLDPVFAFTHRARTMIRNSFIAKGVKKPKKTEEILGCSIAEFMKQIERQFLPGMSWENMHLWEIDHIVPASSAKTLSEAIALNKAGNLRPLWTKDNKSKSGKVLFLV